MSDRRPEWMSALGLSVRAANGVFGYCRDSGIDANAFTVDELACVPDSRLLRLRGMGKVSLAEIRAALRRVKPMHFRLCCDEAYWLTSFDGKRCGQTCHVHGSYRWDKPRCAHCGVEASDRCIDSGSALRGGQEGKEPKSDPIPASLSKPGDPTP